MPKRRKGDVVDDADDATPRKSRRKKQHDDQLDEEAVNSAQEGETPSKRKSILKATPKKGNAQKDIETTPSALRKVLFSAPSKGPNGVEQDVSQSRLALRNDRSAHKKNARALQRYTVDESSEDEELVRESALAKEILQGEASEEESDQDIEVAHSVSTTSTPSKRGRPKSKRRERTPSPPPDLPPHELYFLQNRTGGNKTSSNTFPSHLLLNHEDYFSHINTYKDPHEADIKRLKQYHERAFDQWIFELEEGFNICLYGYGSKRELAMDFAEHMYIQAEKPPKIVVVNGYTPGLTVRDILTTVASVAIPKNIKLPAQPGALVDLILGALSDKPASSSIRVIVHSLDHANLRKRVTQALLARLAAHQNVSMLATCDTLNFPLLWDTTLLRQFRWLYHDATTFKPYTAEIDVVEEVNALLGRGRRRLGGKDGVGYVLKSLPENARNLFRILVAEQLSLADIEPHATSGAVEDDEDTDDILGVEDEEEAAAQQNTPSRRGRGRKPKPKPQKVSKLATRQPEGVEYRTLYHKAVEEFVCSSELNFRTLLKEFHDHQMIESHKDAMGTERLAVPFRREELEAILEELV